MIQGLGPKTSQAHPAKTNVNLAELQQGLQMVAGYGFVDVSPDAQTGRIKVTANLSAEELVRAKEVIEQLAPYAFGNQALPDFEFVSLSGAPLASARSSGSTLAFHDSFQSASTSVSQDTQQAASVVGLAEQPAGAIDAEKIGALASEA